MSKNSAVAEVALGKSSRESQKTDLAVGQDLRELVSRLGTLIGAHLAANTPTRLGDKNNIANGDQTA
jgi:hypothetical protein